MNTRTKEVLSGILESFKTGDIPDAIALASYPKFQVPSNTWSLMNRTLMLISGTDDARGWRQWQQAKRFIKQGAKAIYILVPYVTKTLDKKTGETNYALKGFVPRPVFKVQDTDGETLDYQELELPDFPLMERAVEWGITVKAVPGNYSYQGSYSPRLREIQLATKAESVFFHELAHVAHEKIKGKLQPWQEPFQEIVAELAATALCKLVGKDPRDSLGNSYQYIEAYAEEVEITALTACLKVMSETEKVINLILKGDKLSIAQRSGETLFRSSTAWPRKRKGQ
jgi:hypothetical protein